MRLAFISILRRLLRSLYQYTGHSSPPRVGYIRIKGHKENVQERRLYRREDGRGGGEDVGSGLQCRGGAHPMNPRRPGVPY